MQAFVRISKRSLKKKNYKLLIYKWKMLINGSDYWKILYIQIKRVLIIKSHHSGEKRKKKKYITNLIFSFVLTILMKFTYVSIGTTKLYKTSYKYWIIDKFYLHTRLRFIYYYYFLNTNIFKHYANSYLFIHILVNFRGNKDRRFYYWNFLSSCAVLKIQI